MLESRALPPYIPGSAERTAALRERAGSGSFINNEGDMGSLLADWLSLLGTVRAPPQFLPFPHEAQKRGFKNVRLFAHY